MKKNVKVILGICMLIIPFIFSCSNGDPEPSCNYGTELEAELNAVIASSQAYSTDPTIAKCEAYKSSVQAYLDKLDDYQNCAFIGNQEAEYQAVIDQQQAAIDALVCQ